MAEKAAIEFTRNDMLEHMHKARCMALRTWADLFDKYDLTKDEIVQILREDADDAEACAMVVSLRDQL